MSISYNSVWCYRTKFDPHFVESSEAATLSDWQSASFIVASASLQALMNASREGKGELFEALQFLTECGWHIRHYLEKDALDAPTVRVTATADAEPEMASDVVEFETPVGPDTSKPVLDLDRDADPDYTF